MRSGLKVMIDQVLSHTSIEHPWFVESRAEPRQPQGRLVRVGRRASRRHARPTTGCRSSAASPGTGSRAARQYYLHNFLSSQPDLNFHNPAGAGRACWTTCASGWTAASTASASMRSTSASTTAQLRDNPPKPTELRTGRGFSRRQSLRLPVPLLQQHAAGEPAASCEELRAAARPLPGRRRARRDLVGRLAGDDGRIHAADDRLHMGYSFELLTDDCSRRAHPRHGRERWKRRCRTAGRAGRSPTTTCGAWSRAGAAARRSRALARQLLALVCSLRGSVCLYQGEELGLPEADVPYEALQDPYGIAFWPNFKGRDGCRTPMPWSDGAARRLQRGAAVAAGARGAHRALASPRRMADPGSVLQRGARASCAGAGATGAGARARSASSMRPTRSSPSCVEHEGRRLLVAFNLSPERDRVDAACRPARCWRAPGIDARQPARWRAAVPGAWRRFRHPSSEHGDARRANALRIAARHRARDVPGGDRCLR